MDQYSQHVKITRELHIFRSVDGLCSAGLDGGGFLAAFGICTLAGAGVDCLHHWQSLSIRRIGTRPRIPHRELYCAGSLAAGHLRSCTSATGCVLSGHGKSRTKVHPRHDPSHLLFHISCLPGTRRCFLRNRLCPSQRLLTSPRSATFAFLSQARRIILWWIARYGAARVRTSETCAFTMARTRCNMRSSWCEAGKARPLAKRRRRILNLGTGGGHTEFDLDMGQIGRI